MGVGGVEKDGTADPSRQLSPLAIDTLWAVGWVAAAGLAAALISQIGMPPASLIFLAAVIFASVGRGVRSGLLTAIGGFTAYDYFWVPPVHVIQLRTPYEIVALLIFLGLALITALASGRLKDRERRSAAQQKRLIAFARTGGLVAIPSDPAGAGERIARWVHAVVGSGVYYRDADGTETRAGDAKTWWDTVQTSLRGLAKQAGEQPGRTHCSGDLRARAVADSGQVFGAIVWLSAEGPVDARREIDDVVAVVTDLAAAGLCRARGLRTAA